MFAGRRPSRTNRRFSCCRGQRGDQLSTAFDSVTLYGRDRGEPRHFTQGRHLRRLIATLEDMKALYDGFDLSRHHLGVDDESNGPPDVLAYF